MEFYVGEVYMAEGQSGAWICDEIQGDGTVILTQFHKGPWGGGNVLTLDSQEVRDTFVPVSHERMTELYNEVWGAFVEADRVKGYYEALVNHAMSEVAKAQDREVN